MEIDNTMVGTGTMYDNTRTLMNDLRKCIRIILSGLQESKYPISYSEQDNILRSYMMLIRGEGYNYKRAYPKDFIGPGSFTLQLENIIDSKEDTNIINIRNNYCVTEKADGERKLLYISENGKIYLIDTNMNVIFTGSKTNEKTIFNSLLDGEHIREDKYSKYLNMFAGFDIYYIHGKSVREYPFINYLNIDENDEKRDEGEIVAKKYRLELLSQVIELIKPISILETSNNDETQRKKSNDLIVKCKGFNSSSDYGTIFNACSKKLSDINLASDYQARLNKANRLAQMNQLVGQYQQLQRGIQNAQYQAEVNRYAARSEVIRSVLGLGGAVVGGALGGGFGAL
ncbi:MAG: hypothetical protein ACO3UU_16825, partial [Minisyncoccia bacterium]